MTMSLTTPALLFPAISLLLLAYTNRFLALAALIRNLRAEHAVRPDPVLAEQIQRLRRRVRLIRDMQAVGIASLFLCVASMLLLFFGAVVAGELAFGAALLLMLASLALSLQETWISVDALDLHLRDIERDCR